jgi:hypothetical protein
MVGVAVTINLFMLLFFRASLLCIPRGLVTCIARDAANLLAISLETEENSGESSSPFAQNFTGGESSERYRQRFPPFATATNRANDNCIPITTLSIHQSSSP